MEKKATFVSSILLALILIFAPLSAFSQKRKRPAVPKQTPAATQAKPETTGVEPTVAPPPKKNERPGDTQERVNKRSSPISDAVSEPAFVPAYHYEFTQPEFVVSKIIIEHDEAGKGNISFMKKGYGELISDPVQLSGKTIEKINEILNALNFLATNDSYQYEKDFSHLGTIVFRLTRDGKTRSTTFNWTQNKEAKLLMDEYRKIGNQFIWMFDISLARENQPLESPKLMDSLDSMIRRNEISDPKQMTPFLQSLVNDERIPLIARNHAGKLVKQFEKVKK